MTDSKEEPIDFDKELADINEKFTNLCDKLDIIDEKFNNICNKLEVIINEFYRSDEGSSKGKVIRWLQTLKEK